MRVLIIQNEKTFCKILSDLLEESYYQVDTAENLKDGKYFIGIRKYNLIITSYKFSDGLATDLIPFIKKTSLNTSIIVLSSEYKKEYEIQSLRAGADDFLAKPLDFDILLARIDSRLRLWHSNTIIYGDLTIYPSQERITFQTQEIDIKGKSFRVLTHLAIHKDQIISKEELLDSIWEEPELVTPNVIEVAINQIRQKLDKTFKIKSIETIRNKGYRFCYPS
ncbi:homeostatic response regulator transcription factor HsrA [Helicobacter kayseriensis]|uniref:homeostatic response regulator transcription factor HsrA n=1 Tax=Helicobacter kayseriensis TaxID=2905877 RepID=UPI001E39B4E6|nr:homeostatic response regulator transcription factor HsrA [Helicobacter kayseriensis]MCE3047409.1 homeostatic response regulator transcription factor HsrA [Helicobacter kayseriensis]MCE3048920.1 homeostatic response regulator transcription factor HsrA [Helicobacter kayseriensis]